MPNIETNCLFCFRTLLVPARDINLPCADWADARAKAERLGLRLEGVLVATIQADENKMPIMSTEVYEPGWEPGGVYELASREGN